MNLKTNSIEGLIIIEPAVYPDDRGYFIELFKSTTFKEKNLPVNFVQDNLSMSNKGVVRGLHFQTGAFAQGKLLRCLTGAIYDVAVDIRPGSPTFGKWESVVLSAENQRALYVPEGFAHGIQALEDNTKLLYKCTQLYSKNHEQGILYNDPTLNIEWAIPVTKISGKDLELPTFEQWKKQNL